MFLFFSKKSKLCWSSYKRHLFHNSSEDILSLLVWFPWLYCTLNSKSHDFSSLCACEHGSFVRHSSEEYLRTFCLRDLHAAARRVWVIKGACVCVYNCLLRVPFVLALLRLDAHKWCANMDDKAYKSPVVISEKNDAIHISVFLKLRYFWCAWA